MAIALITAGCGSSLISKQTPSEKPAIAGQPSQDKVMEGLIDIGPKLSPQEVASRLVKGTTTMDEIVALLGPPTSITMQPDSSRMVMYTWRKAFKDEPVLDMKEIVISSLPGPLALIGLGSQLKQLKVGQEQKAVVMASFKSLTMAFDSAGILKDSQFSPPLPTAPLSAVDSSPSLAAVNPSQ